MPTRSETMARRIVRDLQVYSGGKAMQWVPLGTTAARLVLRDDRAIAAALKHAVDAGWVIVEGGHSICLTDEGRALS